MSLRPWWETYQGLLEWELHLLDEAGIPHRLDEAFRRDHGVIKLHVWPRVNGVEKRMEVVYPDLYPWFRPEVVSPDDDLDKHQGPFQKNLCLLPRPPEAWEAGRDSLARLLVEQLPRLYEVQNSHDHPAGLEVHQAEPFTAWYEYGLPGAFVVDGSWDLRGHHEGTFEYVLLRANLGVAEDAHKALVGVVLTVDSPTGTLGRTDEVLAQRYDALPRGTGRWCRLDGPLPTPDPGEARRMLSETIGQVASESLPGQTGRGPRLEVVAGVFPIEATYGGGEADAWVFVVTLDPAATRSERRATGRARAMGRRTLYLQGLRGGRDDLEVRVPELHPLSNKRVLVAGVGGIGAPSAIQLAQARVKLHLIDDDWVEPATSVRYPLGFLDAGRLKIAALLEYLAAHYPHSAVEGRSLRLGRVRLDGSDEPDQTILAGLLDGTDLIYDAIGDHAVGRFLCDLAFRYGIPYVSASTTMGAWGGRVVVLRPGDGPCYGCLLHHIHDQEADEESLAPDSLIPPAAPDGEIRPVGCADATFTGAGFDALPVASAGVRAAVSVLCDGEDGGYPPIDWNVAVLRLRDEEGRPLAGTSFHHRLAQHPECGECARRSAESL